MKILLFCDCNGTQTHNHLISKRTLNHLTKLSSDMAPASSKEFLDIQATVECGFTLKLVRDMIKTYNQYCFSVRNFYCTVKKFVFCWCVPTDYFVLFKSLFC